MSFFKRAWIAVTRRKARTFIMFIILTAISTLIFTGLAVQNATKEASILARQKLGSKITLEFDSEAAMKEQMELSQEQGNKKMMMNINYKAVTEEMAESIAQNKHVYDYNYIVNLTSFSSGFEPITDSQGEKIQEAENEMKDKIQEFNTDVDKNTGRGMPQNMEKIDMANIAMADISIVGVSALGLENNFSQGTYSIINGESITPDSLENAVVIEKTLAQANEINIGDKINIKATSDGEEISLEVVGIYDSGDISQTGMFSGISSSLVYNKIYVKYTKAIEIKKLASSEKDSSNYQMVRGATNSSDGIDKIEFLIDDPQNIDEVLEYAKSTDIDFQTYKLSANDEEFQSMIKPIENVASFSKILVIIVIISGAAIISLILMLWIKERTYETGVLLSLGESKVKVILQYVSEVFIIAMVGFIASVLIGGIISQKVGNILLAQELETIEDTQNINIDMKSGNISRVPMGGGIDNKTTGTEIIKEIDVNVSIKVILQVFGLGILLICVSTAIPVIYVFRYNPKQILTNVG